MSKLTLAQPRTIRLNLIFLALAVICLLLTAGLGTLLWIRIQEPSERAFAFVAAVKAHQYDTAGESLNPPHQPLPGPWAHPEHWGDRGVLGCNCTVAPLTISQLINGVRIVQTTLILDAEPPGSILHHTFVVTAAGLERLPSTDDRLRYPVTLRPPLPPRPRKPLTDDLSLVAVLEDPQPEFPAVEKQVGDDSQKRYMLLGEIDDAAAAEKPRRLLVVLPGGDGSKDFSPFVRIIARNTLSDEWVVVQLIAPTWDERQKERLVWPTERNPYAAAAFTTEQLFDAVVRDLNSQTTIDPEQIYLLAWSSGGPAAYAITLRDRKDPKTAVVAGAMIAMSIFPESSLSLESAAGRSFYLLQSPDDRITRLTHAERAVEALSAAGANVRLEQYAGGHGWRGPVFEQIATGLTWLQDPQDPLPMMCRTALQ